MGEWVCVWVCKCGSVSLCENFIRRYRNVACQFICQREK